MFEFGELGVLLFVLWILFRMGRAGIKNIWCILVGWPLLLAWAIMLGVFSIPVSKLGDDAISLPDGQIGAPLLLFGWAVALAAAGAGRKFKRK